MCFADFFGFRGLCLLTVGSLLILGSCGYQWLNFKLTRALEDSTPLEFIRCQTTRQTAKNLYDLCHTSNGY